MYVNCSSAIMIHLDSLLILKYQNKITNRPIIIKYWVNDKSLLSSRKFSIINKV